MQDPSVESRRLLTPVEWNNQWNIWFDRYAAGVPRFGIWIRGLGLSRATRSLELGAGSARDSRYLSAFFQSTTAVDFSTTAIDGLARSKTPKNFNAICADAKNLPFTDRSFDLSFSKGFIGLFDIAMAKVILLEQARVTSRCMLIGLHNSHNKPLLTTFAAKKPHDNLYNVSFFSQYEAEELVNSTLSCIGRQFTVEILKFGGTAFNFICRKARKPDWLIRRLALLDWLSPISNAENLVVRVLFSN